MNADKIVRALETEVLCENCPHNESNCPDDGCYYIMAAALIDKLQALAENGQSAIDTNMRLVKVVESLQAQLAAKDAEIERLREAQRWIPVTERLPEPEHKRQARTWVLVALKSGCVKDAKFEFYGTSQGFELTGSPITHWLPLPAAPEEGAENE